MNFGSRGSRFDSVRVLFSFVLSSNPWFERGGNYNNGSNAGLFYANNDNGNANNNNAFRVALAPLQYTPKLAIAYLVNLRANGTMCV